MTVVVLIALTSAALFALGSSLQHRSAGTASSTSKRQMMATLLRRPSWLVGALLSAGAFALHAVALSRGDLTVVQPIILSGIVFAVFARSAIDRRLPSRPELGWAAVTWAGLALFIAAVEPSASKPPDRTWAVVAVVVGVLLAAALAFAARWARGRPSLRGVLLAMASGIGFGLIAGLVKLSTVELRGGLTAMLASWPPWVLLGVGAGAILLNQLAYQSTRLSVSAPVLNICQLVVALIFGRLVFDERLLSSPARAVAEIAGLVIMLVGVCVLTSRAAANPGTEPEGSSSSGSPRRSPKLPAESGTPDGR